jgi:hypothetical protein
MNIRLILATAAILVALPLSAARAAPQMLGLLAESNLPMKCADGICTVEVSAICLQEKRDMPAWKTAYRPVQPNQITVQGTKPDGGQIKQPVGDIVRIISERGSWAVTITLPDSALKALGITDAALSLEGRVALTPVAEPDDPSPQSAPEIQAAVTAFNKSPKAIVGGEAPNMAAATVINEMINTLPHVTLDTAEPAGDLWRKTFGTTAHSRPGMRQAAAHYKLCGHHLIMVERGILRRCLELGHDGFVTTVNKRYWDATKPGV